MPLRSGRYVESSANNWDGGSLKVFRGVVTMTPGGKTKPVVHPVMSHFFYMDPADQIKMTIR
jgi:hypothetical protein